MQKNECIIQLILSIKMLNSYETNKQTRLIRHHYLNRTDNSKLTWKHLFTSQDIFAYLLVIRGIVHIIAIKIILKKIIWAS